MDEGTKVSADLIIPKHTGSAIHLNTQKANISERDILVIIISILDMILSHHLDLSQTRILLPLKRIISTNFSPQRSFRSV